MPNFLRNFRLLMLPLAITTGTLGWCAFHYLEVLAPLKPLARQSAFAVLPWLIFTMLFISFCKVDPAKMRPRRWHFVEIAIQIALPALLAAFVHFNPDCAANLALEAIAVCVICPTAAAAAVITGKIGGSESSLTTFIILSNLAAAVSIPLIFPFIGQHAALDFIPQFINILQKVFPIIVLPLLLAFAVRYFLHSLHHFIVTRLKNAAFYVWGFTLTTLSATAVSNVVNSGQDGLTLALLALVGLLCTVGQFYAGRKIGVGEGQRISAGQAMGQKNMMFCIWVTLIYLSPAVAVAPCCYILWQNGVNSWELWEKAKADREALARGEAPCQE